MNKIIMSLLLLSSFLFFPLVNARSTRTHSSDIYTKSYTKKNGTKVKSYYSTPKNNSKKDNYSCLDYRKC